MFIAALFIIDNLWKQLKCPSIVDEWMKMWNGIPQWNITQVAIKKNEILPFATTWMGLEGIMLSEISETEKDKYHMVTLICGI